jgi:hypothetical protein
LRVSRKKCCARKIKTRSQSSEIATAMAPGRVLAIPPGGSKGILQGSETEDAAAARTTRKKTKHMPVINDEESPMRRDQGSSVERDAELHSTDEGSTACMELSPVVPTVSRSRRFESSADFDNDTEQHISDEGKFIYYCSLLLFHFSTCYHILYACLFGRIIFLIMMPVLF